MHADMIISNGNQKDSKTQSYTFYLDCWHQAETHKPRPACAYHLDRYSKNEFARVGKEDILTVQSLFQSSENVDK